MLIQLTDNLYLPGKIMNKNEFLYDLGTGYFAKLTNEELKSQFDFTKSFCGSNTESLTQEIFSKKETL